MVSDDLVMQEARASGAMVYLVFVKKNLDPAW